MIQDMMLSAFEKDQSTSELKQKHSRFICPSLENAENPPLACMSLRPFLDTSKQKIVCGNAGVANVQSPYDLS